MIPFPLPYAPPDAGLLVYFPWFSQNQCFHSIIVILYIFSIIPYSHPDLLSRGVVCKRVKTVSEKTFLYNWTRRTSRDIQELVRTKFWIFKKISKWVYITSFPFHPDTYSVISLEKVTPFMRTASLNNQIALRCVQCEKGDRSRVRPSVLCRKEQLLRRRGHRESAGVTHAPEGVGSPFSLSAVHGGSRALWCVLSPSV